MSLAHLCHQRAAEDQQWWQAVCQAFRGKRKQRRLSFCTRWAMFCRPPFRTSHKDSIVDVISLDQVIRDMLHEEGSAEQRCLAFCFGYTRRVFLIWQSVAARGGGDDFTLIPIGQCWQGKTWAFMNFHVVMKQA